MMSLFDHLNNISLTKDYDALNDIKDYNPFMINKFLSMNKDTLFFANLMNTCHSLQPETQYLFYLQHVPKLKRYFKYSKKLKNEMINNINDIQQYFNCSLKEAELYCEVLSQEQLKVIQKKLKSLKEN